MIKDAIIMTIEDKKSKTIKEYDDKIDQIKNEENIAKLYYLLAQTFHNTLEQGEIGLVLLRESLNDNFFKEAEGKINLNHVVFFNEDFEVSFSKSLMKQIIIKYKDVRRPSHFYSSIDNSTLKLKELTEIYLNKKSLKNLKALANYNCRHYQKNPIATAFKYINTIRDCNQGMLYNIKVKQDADKKRKERIDDEIREFDKRQDYAKDFVKSLEHDLNIFKKEGWNIRLYGILDEKGKISFE